jgi:isocitrate/isopropylmalate dehydrogenase
VWACDAYVEVERKGQYTSAHVSTRQHTSAYPFIFGAAYGSLRQHKSAYVSIHQHTSAYVSIRQHTEVREVKCEVRCKGGGVVWACDAYVEVERNSSDSYVSIRQHTCQHTSEYVSIRQHTSAYVEVERTSSEARVRE